MTHKLGKLMTLPRVDLAHKPTPLEAMTNMSAQAGESQLYVKRDDCTGLAFGGNKVRQLEFYLGEAVSQGADTVLITGAVQSNFVRLTAAAACKLGLACHIQLEDRVPDVDEVYRNSGNVLLDRMLGARVHYYEKGEDETGADRRIGEIASALENQGRRPYVIHLAPGHAPLGALGYVLAAQEILDQIEAAGLDLDEIVVASGSGHTHAGLLFGLKALGSNTRLTGICVRRDAVAQRERISNHCVEISDLLEVDSPVNDSDINLIDDFLSPGYGRINPPALEAIELAAQLEGLIVDPTYTAKSMAGFIHRARHAGGTGAARMLFIHTGGQPAIFGSEPKLTEYFKQSSMNNE
jgi:D-cysteine desulfhydrase/L-cysteate sulfo-lyase